MSSSTMEDEAPDLACQLEHVQGFDALGAVRWKHHQDAVVELSEHGIVLTVEESGCLQAKVYLKRGLGLLVDCLNAFAVPGQSSVIEIQYPGLDMQVLLKKVNSQDASIYAEIRTRIPDTMPWDYNFEPAGTNPLTFTVKHCRKLLRI